MTHPRRSRALLLRAVAVVLSSVVVLSALASAEDPPKPPPAPDLGTPLPPGGVPPRGSPERTAWRESMWRAPTAEDWEKPVLITFQRTWDDAVAVAKETGRAILVCINMDGEIASEHYAGVRYRQPEIAALYEPYVAVIASVYRHNPRDHDDQGRRILCPRFGSVTCGEHIAIEPGIYEKFCDGQRIAPRHIMVELDGKETYDVFYANDTASVFQAIKDGIANRAAPATPPVVRGDRPVVERVASRDVRDRTAVEAAYQSGDPEVRKALLDAAVKHPEVAPLDLLRLAVFGFDVDLSRTARQALTRVETPDATTLVADAMRVPMEASERAALVATLQRLGTSSELARWLAVVHRGLGEAPAAVDVGRWSERRGSGTYAPAAPAVQESDLAVLETRVGAGTDPTPRLDLAAASLEVAMRAPETHAHDPRARLLRRNLLDEARRQALEAERLGASGWSVNAVVALAAYHAADFPEAYRRAEAAVKDLPAGDGQWLSMATLVVFAEGRWKQIRRAVKDKQDFPPSWLADVNSAYSVLLEHPLGTDGQVLWHYDLLDWLGATHQAARVLRRGIARWPASTTLHDRLRTDVLKQRGPDGLEAAYADLEKEAGASPVLGAFAAQAAVAAGDVHRRQGRLRPSLAAYERAVAAYDRALAARPETREAVDEAVALALASRARVAYQLGDDEAALADLLASFARAPGAAGTRDGVGITPAETGQMLLARLAKGERSDLASKLEAALAGLDPEFLRPDRE
jgi:tetratricopeptide (TPR) repeat protein